MLPRSVRTGATCGLFTWGIFAGAEIATCTLRPLAMGYYQVVEPSHWHFIFILLFMYLATGALAGAVVGRLSRGSMQEKSTLILTLVYVVNLLVERRAWEFADRFALAIAALIFMCLSAALLLPRRLRWAGVIADPWLAAGLL